MRSAREAEVEVHAGIRGRGVVSANRFHIDGGHHHGLPYRSLLDDDGLTFDNDLSRSIVVAPRPMVAAMIVVVVMTMLPALPFPAFPFPTVPVVAVAGPGICRGQKAGTGDSNKNDGLPETSRHHVLQ